MFQEQNERRGNAPSGLDKTKYVISDELATSESNAFESKTLRSKQNRGTGVYPHLIPLGNHVTP